VQRWRVREDLERGEVAGCPETCRFHPVGPDLLTGRQGLGESKLAEFGIQPRFGHQMCRRRWADLLGELGHAAMVFGGEDALLDA
jgi:hypothetical protein